MSAFDLIRILYATHFVLGIPIAALSLHLLIFNPIPALLSVGFSQPDLSESDIVQAVSLGGLIYLWYFVWFGSIVFALYRTVPILSIRLFSLMVLITYAGWVAYAAVKSDDIWALAMENPLFPLGVLVMLLVGLTGVTVLPRLKAASDAEEQAFLERNDRMIDQSHPWHKADPK